MAFRISGKSRELGRLVLAGGLGGGVGFALADHFGVQQIPNLDQNMRDGIHVGIGAAVTVLGAGFNKMWLAELGASYLAVPIARLVERNALGGIPSGMVRVPTGQVTSLHTNGRTGVGGTPYSAVKTF